MLRVTYTGYLDIQTLQVALGKAQMDLRPGMAVTMVVDASEMRGYDRDARAFFIAWNRKHRASVRAVGVVTTNPLWRMIIHAMSLASTQRMKPFNSLEEALDWAER
ncbi:MAG: STAS/SEC14 domain-containing protein [Nannocystaceae bacterium]